MVHLAKAVVKTQLKRSERTLRGTISRAVTDMNRLVTQQMSKAQYREAGPLVEEVLTQVLEEYRGIVSKLEAAILSEEQASEEDAVPLTTTDEFFSRVLPEVSSIQTKMVENMPHPEQAAGSGAVCQEAEAVQAPSERKALRLDHKYIPKFHFLAPFATLHTRRT